VEVDSLLDVRRHLRWRDHPPGVLLAERTSDGEADGFLRAAFWRLLREIARSSSPGPVRSRFPPY